MKNILILGGTKYLGKELVNLLEDDYELFVFSRKEIKNDKKVNFVKIDRDSLDSIYKAINGTEFDCVIDFINYSSFHSLIFKKLLEKKVRCNHYIMISSTFIYYPNVKNNVIEDDFNPYDFKYKVEKRDKISYELSKKNSEAFIAQNFEIPFSIIRFPIILSSDDYTGRFEFIPKMIMNKKIQKNQCNNKFQVIFKSDASVFLKRMIKKKINGIFNFCAKELISEEILWNFFLKLINTERLDKVTVKNSPFNFETELKIDCSKAYRIYKPKNTFFWIEKELKKLKYVIKE